MKESVGYTVTINIIIVFVVIIFAFLSAALIYYKSNKISNVVTNSIEKYEGYNSLARNEIERNMSSLGYNIHSINCKDSVSDKKAKNDICQIVDENYSSNKGYCVYLCIDKGEEEYYYKIRTNMMINIPIINNILDIPIYSNTNRLYDFSNNFET